MVNIDSIITVEQADNMAKSLFQQLRAREDTESPEFAELAKQYLAIREKHRQLLKSAIDRESFIKRVCVN